MPSSQNLARGLIRDSDFNFFDNFIKVKKFNANIKRLTVYTESKTDEGVYNNIYIKKILMITSTKLFMQKRCF